MKILILVLSADFHPYNQMIKTGMETWDSVQVPDMETLYYCGASHKANTDKIVYLPVTESLLTMGYKTLGALKYALEYKDFDFIARVHSSIYVDKKELVNYVESLPKENLFMGVEADSVHGKYCWGGVGYIISKDVVKKIVDNKDLWLHHLMEDQSMSILAKQLGFDFSKGLKACSIDAGIDEWKCISYCEKSITFTDFNDVKKMGHFYYRVKQDGKRDIDEYLMKQLFAVLK